MAVFHLFELSTAIVSNAIVADIKRDFLSVCRVSMGWKRFCLIRSLCVCVYIVRHAYDMCACPFSNDGVRVVFGGSGGDSLINDLNPTIRLKSVIFTSYFSLTRLMGCVGGDRAVLL